MKKIFSSILIYLLLFSNLYSGMSIRGFDIAKDLDSELYLNSSVESSISLRDDTYVTQWNDLSINNNHAVQPIEANQASYVDSINSKSVVTFSKTDNAKMDITSVITMPSQGEAIVLLDIDSASEDNMILASSLVNNQFVRFQSNGSLLMFNGGQAQSNAGVVINTFMIFEYEFDGANVVFKLNGIIQPTIGLLNASGFQVDSIGSLLESAGSLNGKLAVILINDKIYNDTTRNQIYKNLQNEWGL